MGVLFNHFAGITIEVVVIYPESLSQEVFQGQTHQVAACYLKHLIFSDLDLLDGFCDFIVGIIHFDAYHFGIDLLRCERQGPCLYSEYEMAFVGVVQGFFSSFSK